MGRQSIPPPYIIDRKNEDNGNYIQLEIPDYSLEYEEYLRKISQETENNKQETVIIIDIY